MLNQIVYEAVPVLTATPFQPILASLSNMKVEFSSSFSLGFNKPLSNVVFLCPSKIKAVLIRLLSMVGCIGQPLWLVVPKGDTANPIQSAAQCFAATGSGLKPQSLGHTAMNTSTGEIRPKSNQTNQQAQIQDLLNLAIQELSNIEKLSTYCTGSAIGYGLQINEIFQHSQKALNILHDLKNLRA